MSAKARMLAAVMLLVGKVYLSSIRRYHAMNPDCVADASEVNPLGQTLLDEEGFHGRWTLVKSLVIRTRDLDVSAKF